MIEKFIGRIRESIITPEIPKTFSVYSGTALQNYTMSAYVTPEGVFYDKLKNPRNLYKEFYFFDIPEYAFEYASINAYALWDLPVVISGNIPIKYKGGRDRLPAGTIFSVSHLWIPRDDITPENMAEKLSGVGYETLMSNFIKVDPASLLE